MANLNYCWNITNTSDYFISNITNISSYDVESLPMMSELERKMYEYIYYLIQWIFPLLLALVAIFANVTIIVTLMTKKNKMFSTTVFFLSLAISDLMAACLSSLRDWIWNFDFVYSQYIFCNIISPANEWFKFVSSFSLAAITLERTLCVCLPLKVKIVCSKQNAKYLVFSIWISTGIYSVVTGVFSDVGTLAGTEICIYKESFKDFLRYDLYVYLSLYFIIPFFIISSGSLIIVYMMYVRSKKSLATNRPHIKTLTFTLIIANVAFVLTKTPYIIFQFVTIIFPCWTDLYAMARFLFLLTFASLLEDLSHTLNFFIYYFSGSVFKKDVKTLFAKIWKKICCR